MSQQSSQWFNRTVAGAAVTSFLADLSYEAALSVLPSYLRRLGATTAILGAIEGSADALASFTKLAAGSWSDAIARRKPFVVVGYFLTGVMPVGLALAAAWPLVAAARLAGWFGKGFRGPARDALLSASVPAEHRGKAFGLHRACDTVGAVIGPLVGAQLLQAYGGSWKLPERVVLWWTVAPGLLAALAFFVMVREVRNARMKKYDWGGAARQLPAKYRRFLVGVGLFGAADFSPLLLNAAVIALFAPKWGALDAGVLAAYLVALRHFTASLAAFPAGYASDRWGRLPLLASGYALAAVVFAGFAAAASAQIAQPAVWAGLFAAAGLYVGVQESLESAAAADLVPDADLHGTAFGVLGAVNGCGDFAASVVVGNLALLAPGLGFAYAALLAAAGAVLTARCRSLR